MVAKNVLHTIGKNWSGVATVQNRDNVAQTQELINDMPSNEASCTDGKNLHIDDGRSNARETSQATINMTGGATGIASRSPLSPNETAPMPPLPDEPSKALRN